MSEEKTETQEETKPTETKTETKETKAEEKDSDAAALKIGAEFDKKADEGEVHTAYTDTEAKAKEEAEAKKKAEEKSSEEAPEDEVDESLLERAEQAGMSREKAEMFKSKEDLKLAVEWLEETKQSKEKTPEEVEAEKKAKEQAEAKAKEDEAPYDCGLDPDEYEESLIKAVNQLGTDLKKRIVALEASQTKHAKTIASNSVTRHTDWLDSRINSLNDEDLEKVYGKGDIDDLEEGSEQFMARATLDRKITKIAGDLRKSNKKVPSRNKLFDMAVKALHKKTKTKKADAETKAKAEARAKEAVGPGSSKVSAKTSDEKALQIQIDFDKKLDEE